MLLLGAAIEAIRDMHYEVLFLALTTSLLNLDDAHRGSAFLEVESSFEGLEFRKMRVKGHTSVGARVRPDTDLTLHDWIESLRKQGLRRAGIPRFESPTDFQKLLSSLSPMQQQAHHSGTLRMIACEFLSQSKYYVLELESSSPHLMSAEKFGDMLLDQPAGDEIWKALFDEVRLYDATGVTNVAQMRDYFYTRAGAKALAANGDSILLVAQSAAQRAGFVLQISEKEKVFFTTGDDAEGVHEMLGGAADEFIAFEDLLVLNGSATTAELARLFDAQICGPAVWERVADSLVRIGELKPNLKSSEWRKVFLSLDAEKIEVYTRSFIQALQEACRACDYSVRVTDEFEGRLETYFESLDTQARAAHISSDQRLHFSPNLEPWNHFYFGEVGTVSGPASKTTSGSASSSTSRSTSGSASSLGTTESASGSGASSSRVVGDAIKAARIAAQQAMRLGYAFATRIDSDYAKVFALMNMILSTDAEPLFEGQISIEDFLFELQTQGHDRAMQERLETAWPMAELFRALKLNALQIQALCASSIAEVFCGMGDWNDTYFSDPADQKEFEEISQTVFQAIQALQLNALSIQEMGTK